MVRRCQTLAQPALAAVREGRTTFVPKAWEKTYFDWLENIQPWCISRQLWWGHRIPAWYGPDGAVFVADSEAEAQLEAAAHYGRRRWTCATTTCSTPGSPPRCGRSRPSAGREQTAELARFYPTSTLVTGFDIIFFWVARMMMMGLHFTGEAPVRHGLHARPRP